MFLMDYVQLQNLAAASPLGTHASLEACKRVSYSLQTKTHRRFRLTRDEGRSTYAKTDGTHYFRLSARRRDHLISEGRFSQGRKCSRVDFFNATSDN
jgi:hypothetical protein